MRRIFNMKTYEYELPLKHPDHMIADMEYLALENKILCLGKPMRKFFRRIETMFLSFRYYGISGLFKRLKKKLKKGKSER